MDSNGGGEKQEMAVDLPDYLKKVRLGVDIDEQSVDDAAKKLDKGLEKGLNKNFQKQISNIFDGIKTEFLSTVSDGLTKIKDFTINSFKDGWKEIQNLVNYSTLSNKNFRDLAFTYGFSSSEAYGFDKAKQILGFDSEEDLMYAEPWQKQKFQEVMTKFADNYNELYDKDFFEQYLDFQYEWAEFKQDILLDFTKFFLDNKDLIKQGMTGILKILEVVTNVADWVIDKLGLGSSLVNPNISDTVNNIVNSGYNKSVTINQNNNFTNVPGQSNVNFENPGEMTCEQIIRALA